jgi:tetratricopeptide (TPR) repeat protein
MSDDDPRCNLWAGATYAKLGDYHKAVRAYGDAIAVSDRYTPAYANRALAYWMLGEYVFLGAFDPTNYTNIAVADIAAGGRQKESPHVSATILWVKNGIHQGLFVPEPSGLWLAVVGVLCAVAFQVRRMHSKPALVGRHAQHDLLHLPLPDSRGRPIIEGRKTCPVSRFLTQP